MFAFCRPGGSLTDGPAAQRLPQQIQQAWWNGWKKLHGMKWQTIILANGMDAHVFGPISARENDLQSLNLSGIINLLSQLQQQSPIKYKLYGDSAYWDGEFIGTGGGRGMASVRETIEWSYAHVKTQWKYCNYESVLTLRRQPIAKIFFVCMLLRNVYVTLNGNQICEYMNIMPPTLEAWLSQGPQAKPYLKTAFFILHMYLTNCLVKMIVVMIVMIVMMIDINNKLTLNSASFFFVIFSLGFSSS
jgi:hypothetical protein